VSSRLVENVAICAGSRVDVGVREGLSYPSTAEVFFFKCDCTLVTWVILVRWHGVFQCWIQARVVCGTREWAADTFPLGSVKLQAHDCVRIIFIEAVPGAQSWDGTNDKNFLLRRITRISNRKKNATVR
jgi:hypothetical protein